MTAQIAGFVTRANAGLRAPKSVSKSITPQNGGVAIHYGGPRQPAADPGSDHALCVRTWHNWQTYHMNTHGWVDIAYTGGFCNHGYAFAGRGAGVRTAANGTNPGNQNFYAVTWIGGEGQTPSPEAINAADWWVNTLRLSGAGTAVKPHRYFKPTGCPGNPLASYAASMDRQSVALPAPVSAPKPMPAPAQSVPSKPVSAAPLQRAVRTTADGIWGPITDKRCNAVVEASEYGKVDFPYGVGFTQQVVGTKPDGKWGPNSVKAHAATVKHMQLALKTMGFDPGSADGVWGPNTHRAFVAARNARRR